MPTATTRLQVAFLPLLTAALAAAQPPAPAGPVALSVFDTNGDGVVSEEEFDAVRRERMATRAETGAPMRRAPQAPTFAEIDSDGDGRLSAEELAAAQRAPRAARPGAWSPGAGPGMRAMPEFADFDSDGDGRLTAEEFEQARERRRNARAQQRLPMRKLQDAPTFEAMDADGDGIVTPAEFARRQEARRAQRRR